MTRDREDTVAIHPAAPIVDTLGAQRAAEWRARMNHSDGDRTFYGYHRCGPSCSATFDEIPGPVRLGRDSSEAKPAGMAIYPRGRG